MFTASKSDHHGKMRALVIDEHFLYDMNSAWIGRVHSVYGHALNVLGPDQKLYTLVDCTLDPAPRAVVVDGIKPFEGVSPGARVVFRKNHLRIGRTYTVDLSGVQAWSGALEVKRSIDRDGLLERVHAFDRLYLGRLPFYGCAHYYRTRRGLAVQRMGVVEEMLADRIHAFIGVLRNGRPAREVVGRLVGFGRGLTPSGDDFLAGFLWASHVFGAAAPWYKELREILSEKEPDTTAVSRQMLQTATEGVARQRIGDFLHLMMSNNCLDNNIINSILTIGSTSGADQLIGMLMAMELVGTVRDRR